MLEAQDGQACHSSRMIETIPTFFHVNSVDIPGWGQPGRDTQVTAVNDHSYYTELNEIELSSFFEIRSCYVSLADMELTVKTWLAWNSQRTASFPQCWDYIWPTLSTFPCLLSTEAALKTLSREGSNLPQPTVQAISST